MLPHTATTFRRPAAKPHVLTIVATEYRFEAPSTVPAGMTTVRLLNHGKEAHMAGFELLQQGKTAQDLEAAIKEYRPLRGLVSAQGGAAAPAGGEATLTMDLRPGNYVIICAVPDSAGVPHFAKGMLRAITVTPSTGPTAAMPSADLIMGLREYGFVLSGPVTRGHHVIMVSNDGTQLHEAGLFRLQPGQTMQEFLASIDKGPTALVNAMVTAVTAMVPGRRVELTVDFAPGRYVLLCLVPDAKDHRPHYKHGMVREVVVR